MATVHFPILGSLEIPAEPTFIHVLEANHAPNWTGTGPGFAMGDRIITSQEPAGQGVVHGYMTQEDGSTAVLIWLNETVKYIQIRPDHVQREIAALSKAGMETLPFEQPPPAQTHLRLHTLMPGPEQ